MEEETRAKEVTITISQVEQEAEVKETECLNSVEALLHELLAIRDNYSLEFWERLDKTENRIKDYLKGTVFLPARIELKPSPKTLPDTVKTAEDYLTYIQNRSTMDKLVNGPTLPIIPLQ